MPLELINLLQGLRWRAATGGLGFWQLHRWTPNKIANDNDNSLHVPNMTCNGEHVLCQILNLSYRCRATR
jgi:hypothetical protein